MISITCTTGRTEIILDNVFSGLALPSRFILVLARSDQLTGTYKSNPYFFARKFGRAKLIKTEVTFDGNSIDGWQTTIDNPFLQAQFEYRRLQMYTGQAKQSTFTTGINFWSFVEEGSFKILNI